MPQEMLDWGIEIVLYLQALFGLSLVGAMYLITATGYTEFYFLVLPLVYWSVDSRVGLRLAVVLLMSIALNLILKTVVHDPRPYWVDTRVRLLAESEITFGMPSGHAQNAVVLWGSLAYEAGRRWLWVLALALIGLTAVSRVYLGVHFPSDVVAGVVIGTLLLTLFIMYGEGIWQQLVKVPPLPLMGGIFLLSLLLLAANILLTRSLAGSWQFPAAWNENALLQAPDVTIAPLGHRDILNTAGVFFGLLAGAIWINSAGGYSAQGSLFRRVLRYLVGVLGVLLLLEGLGLVFDLLATDESALGYILRYIRYALVGAWISLLAPLTFVRLGLTE